MSVFRNPMDEAALRQRLVHVVSNPIYALAAQAAGHQGRSVDQLSWKLKQRLPALVAELAAEVEAEARS